MGKAVDGLMGRAERARWLATTLTNPDDAATLLEYARELEGKAARREGRNAPSARLFWPHPGFAEAQLVMLRRTLKRVFPTQPADKFDDLLRALDGHGGSNVVQTPDRSNRTP